MNIYIYIYIQTLIVRCRYVIQLVVLSVSVPVSLILIMSFFDETNVGLKHCMIQIELHADNNITAVMLRMVYCYCRVPALA